MSTNVFVRCTAVHIQTTGLLLREIGGVSPPHKGGEGLELAGAQSPRIASALRTLPIEEDVEVWSRNCIRTEFQCE